MAEPRNTTGLELILKQLKQAKTGNSDTYLDTLKSIYGVGGNDISQLEGGALGSIIINTEIKEFKLK